MGEIADLIIEGDMCQLCGELMEGEGFPQTCAACLAGDDDEDDDE